MSRIVVGDRVFVRYTPDWKSALMPQEPVAEPESDVEVSCPRCACALWDEGVWLECRVCGLIERAF